MATLVIVGIVLIALSALIGFGSFAFAAYSMGKDQAEFFKNPFGNRGMSGHTKGMIGMAFSGLVGLAGIACIILHFAGPYLEN
jgi:hypothetical protein